MKKVAIIIPVYRATSSVRRLLDELQRTSRGLSPAVSIWIVDDGSREQTLSRLFRTHAIFKRSSRVKIHLLTLPTNLGFPRAVNAGIYAAWEAGPRDVLVLNSDTLFDLGDLRRLQASVKSARVGSVTPVTNQASLVGLFQWPRGGKIPAGITREEVQRVIRKIGARDIDLPRGVGFCIYLTARALREVGLLDEVSYGPGYGEIADWSIRASRKGFRHRLNPRVFVFHEGASSFGAQRKKALLKRNDAELERRYPGFSKPGKAWVKRDPLRRLRDRLNRELLLLKWGAGEKPKRNRLKPVRTSKTPKSSARRTR